MQKRLLSFLLFLLFLVGNNAYAQFVYFNSFKTDEKNGITLSGSAKLTSGTLDPTGDGVLRLTEDEVKQRGYCLIDQAFDFSKGLRVEFEFFTHTTQNVQKADGTTFFLYNPSEGFEAGADGGALGYAQNETNPGMKNGFLVIGIDEFGNFGVASESKSGGIPDANGVTHPNRLQGDGLIAVRGGVGPNKERTGSTAYPFIGGKVTGAVYGSQTVLSSYTLPNSDWFSISTTSRNTKESDAGYRRVRMDLEKSGGTGFIINVDVFVGGWNPRWINVLNNVSYTPAAGIPAVLKGGFSASTGDFINKHEIRNVLITPSMNSLLSPVANPDNLIVLAGQTGTINIITHATTGDNAKVNLPGGDFKAGSIDLNPTTPAIDNSYNDSGKGTFSVDANGLVTFTPDNGYTGTALAKYTFLDTYGKVSNIANINVTVNADKPTIKDIVKTTVPKNTKISFTENDFRSQYVGSTFTKVRLTNLPNTTTQGALKLNNVAVVDFQEINVADLSKLEFTPIGNFIGTVQFTWNGSNGSNYADDAKTVSMAFVNQKPTVASTTETVKKNVTLSPLVATTFTGQFSDTDAGDALVNIKITKIPGLGTLRGNKGSGLAVLAVGDVIPAANLSSVSYEPALNSIAQQTFQWQAYDGQDYSLNTAEAIVTLNIQNDAPTAGAITKNDGFEDQVLKFVEADFVYSDANSDPINKIQFVTLPDQATYGKFQLNNGGVISVISTSTEIIKADLGKIEFVPAPDYFGTIPAFSWKASDGTIYSSNASVSITIKPVNDKPSFTKGANQTLNFVATPATQSIAGWATAISMGPVNESSQAVLNFTVTNDKSTLFNVQPAIAANGTLTYTPATGQVGKATVTVKLQDNGGTANGGIDLSDAQTFEITIKPTGSNDTDVTTVGTAKTTDVKTNDGVGAVTGIVITPSTSTKGVTPVVDGTGKVTYTPPTGYVGKDSYTYTLSKDGATSDPITVAFEVKPVGTNDKDYVQPGSSVTTNVKTNDTPNDNQTKVVIVSQGTKGTAAILNDVTGTITYTPNASFTTTDTYTYKLVTSDGVESAPITVTIDKVDLSLEKSVIGNPVPVLNSFIDYNIVITNTGQASLSSVVITDAGVTVISGDLNVGSLAVGQSKTVSVRKIVAQDDIDAGLISNAATANGKSPNGGDVTKVSDNPLTTNLPNDPTIITIPQNPKIRVEKTAASGTYQVGSTIAYTIKVINEGNVKLNTVRVVDTKISSTAITLNDLDPGKSGQTIVNYVVKQEDVDAGRVANLATATAKTPQGAPISKTSINPLDITVDSTIVIIPQNPKIRVEKTAASGTYQAGSTIAYTIKVINEGNVKLNTVRVNDPKISSTSFILNDLDPGRSGQTIVNYVVKQEDVDAGRVTNLATATAKTPQGAPISKTSINPLDMTVDSTIVNIIQNPKLKVEKRISSTGTYKVGSVITYKIKVLNDGNVTLKSISLIDNKISPNAFAIRNLTPTDFEEVTFNYTVTQADVDAGFVSNQAIVTAVPPTGSSLTQKSDDPSKPGANDPTDTEVGIDDPIANNDKAEGEVNKDLKIAILDNDKADGSLSLDPASIEIVNEPIGGTLKINADGTVTYTPNKSFVGNDEFTYTVKDNAGNVTNMAVVSIVIKGFVLPNVFTPNGDGKNDSFVIEGRDNYDSADLTIFNRWGNEVYRNKNYQDTWVGEGLNAGTYYYIVKLTKGKTEDVRKGWVLIKR